MRWSSTVLIVVASLLIGASFGYLMPRSAAGKEGRSLLPMVFEEGMEVFLGTSRVHVPREPGFVSDGNCRLSGLVKFFPSATDDSSVVRLGYAVDLEHLPHDAQEDLSLTGLGDASIHSSPYDVQFSFALLDRDGFPLYYVRTATQSLNPGESIIFQGITEQPIPCNLADRARNVECRLCFEGIEVP